VTYPNNDWSTGVTAANVTVVNNRTTAWNGGVSPGGSASFAFNGTNAGTNTSPTAFAVNGISCT
jgi:cellulose 1,4-beta-cellobiosidase